MLVFLLDFRENYVLEGTQRAFSCNEFFLNQLVFLIQISTFATESEVGTSTESFHKSVAAFQIVCVQSP